MAKGGKTLNDRVLAAAVRQLGLRRIKKQFEEEPDSEFSKQLLLKLAPTLLPRINEGSGDQGEFIIKQITGTVIQSDDSDIQDQDSTAN